MTGESGGDVQDDDVSAVEIGPKRIENNPPRIKTRRLLIVELRNAGMCEFNKIFPCTLYQKFMIGTIRPPLPKGNAIPMGFN